MRHLLRLALFVGIVSVFSIATSAALGDAVSATCTWGGQSQTCASNTWYPSSVTVVWSTDTPPDQPTSGCDLGVAYHYNTDGIDALSCTATWGGTGDTKNYTLHVETSSPVVSVASSSNPNSNGWYNHPVTFTFSGTSYSQGVTCTPPTTFAGPDEMNAVVPGSCTDNAGKTTTKSVSLNYDATPPTNMRVFPSRPPDFHGWYNHPVSFTFIGSDSVSGIDSCSGVTYSGPTSGAATVLGSCRDRAGNVATLPVPFHYDATPPSLQASAAGGDGDVTVRWQTSAGLSALTITRSPRVPGRGDKVVGQGGGSGTFNDTRVRNGVRYRYTITAIDQAGNISTRVVTATPGRRLLFPVGGVRLASPPVLMWTSVRHASYYNVQLYRDGRKVLSVWPSHPELGLTRSWEFDHHRFHLKPGRYLWYVWPGFGPRRAGLYGPRIGSGTFVVT